jgi:hypothetical protein
MTNAFITHLCKSKQGIRLRPMCYADPMAEYKSAIVTYLDILGFRRFVESSKTTPDEILSLLKVTKGATGIRAVTFTKGEMKTHTEIQTFSDLVIRQVECDETNFVDRLNNEMNTLAHIQLHLLTSKGRTLIRGGISKGRCYMDTDFVFGPAMVRSYELEQSAVFPRIIIDRNLIRDFRDGLKKPISETLQSLVRQGEDGIFFIDYLKFAVFHQSLSLGRPDTGEEILLQHKTAAEDKLGELSHEKDPLRRKAVWLAKYHNSVAVDSHVLFDTTEYRIPLDKLT